MRILLVHNSYRSGSPGGEDKAFQAERDALNAAGHDVVVYSRSNDEFFCQDLSQKLHAASSMLFPRVVGREISKVIDTFDPQVVHVHNVFPLIGVAGYMAASRRAIPVFQTLHNYRWSCTAATHFYQNSVCNDCAPQRFRAAISKRCYRDSAVASWIASKFNQRVWRAWQDPRSVYRFVALTEFMARRLINAGIAPTRVTVKPNGVRLAANYSSVPKDSARREPFVVFSGRLSSEKGLMTLVDAWRRLPNIPLKIVGAGPLFEPLSRLVAREGLPIELLGHLRADVAQRVVARASLQVVPSEWFEGMPLVVLEAWAVGTPVLASRIGGLAEMITDGLNGRHFRPGDPVDLADKVQALMSDLSQCERLTIAGRKAIETRHSIAETVKALTSMYRTAIRCD